MSEGGERISDQELRRAQLRLSDPYQQEGLVSSLPEGTGLVAVENTYAFDRWPDEKVWCVKCGGHRHKHGFTALLSNGARALYGSKCGAEEFGESWPQATRRLGERVRRQTYLSRLDEMLPHIPEIRRRLALWRPTCERITATKLRFERTFGPLYQALGDAARRQDDKLLAYERVRDFQAEQRSNKKDDGPHYRWVQRVAHIIPRGYFHDLDAAAVLDAAQALLADILAAASNTDAIKTSQMTGLEKRRREVTEKLVLVAEMSRDGLAFFSPDNLREVARWATRADHIPGQYTVMGNELVEMIDEHRMGLPQGFRLLDEDLLALLRNPASLPQAA